MHEVWVGVSIFVDPCKNDDGILPDLLQMPKKIKQIPEN